MEHVVHWFEIPSADFERAIRFYEAVLGVGLRREAFGPMQMAVIPHGDGVGGAVVHMAGGQPPGPAGALVYLAGGDDLAGPLARAVAAGGQVVVPKTAISPAIGHFAVFRDSEGNHVGLHSLR